MHSKSTAIERKQNDQKRKVIAALKAYFQRLTEIGVSELESTDQKIKMLENNSSLNKIWFFSSLRIIFGFISLGLFAGIGLMLPVNIQYAGCIGVAFVVSVIPTCWSINKFDLNAKPHRKEYVDDFREKGDCKQLLEFIEISEKHHEWISNYQYALLGILVTIMIAYVDWNHPSDSDTQVYLLISMVTVTLIVVAAFQIILERYRVRIELLRLTRMVMC